MKEADNMESKARITAIGTYIPEKVLTNADFEKMVDTSDEWIVQRTGIKERRIAAEDEYVTDLCENAARNLAKNFNKSLDDVDLILVATVTGEFKFPSVSSQLQARLGLKNTGALDLGGACAGFVYGLHMANGLVSSGLHKKVLVLGGETLSKITDYTDRTSCILFGDGAGAALVEYDAENPGFFGFHMGTKGEGGRHLYQTGLSTKLNGEELTNPGKLVQNGREVYKWAVSGVPKGVKKLVEEANMSLDDIDWFIPHSANMRMVESICDRLDYPVEKTLTSMAYAGNTSSATIPLAFDFALQENKVKDGDTMLLYGFGGGLTECGIIIKWDPKA